jgi:hypothetical protein
MPEVARELLKAEGRVQVDRRAVPLVGEVVDGPREPVEAGAGERVGDPAPAQGGGDHDAREIPPLGRAVEGGSGGRSEPSGAGVGRDGARGLGDEDERVARGGAREQALEARARLLGGGVGARRADLRHRGDVGRERVPHAEVRGRGPGAPQRLVLREARHRRHDSAAASWPRSHCERARGASASATRATTTSRSPATSRSRRRRTVELKAEVAFLLPPAPSTQGLRRAPRHAIKRIPPLASGNALAGARLGILSRFETPSAAIRSDSHRAPKPSAGPSRSTYS